LLSLLKKVRCPFSRRDVHFEPALHFPGSG
jgi:hypothetical protein